MPGVSGSNPKLNFRFFFFLLFPFGELLDRWKMAIFGRKSTYFNYYKLDKVLLDFGLLWTFEL